jgi:hypothetical protein
MTMIAHLTNRHTSTVSSVQAHLAQRIVTNNMHDMRAKHVPDTGTSVVAARNVRTQ